MKYNVDEKIVREKRDRLIRYLGGLESLLVAFSGGVDSTLLLALAHEALGPGVKAVTAISATYPEREREAAREFAEARGIEQIVIESDELSLPEFVRNGPNRCYHCKKALGTKMLEIAAQNGIRHVAHGANLDDRSDYRPGMKAAEEMGFLAPFLREELTKEEIRFLCREMNFAVWDKPSMACLASRIPYGDPITKDKLYMIDQAEAYLNDQGFGQCRVRVHGVVARIEIGPEEMSRFLDGGFRTGLVERFREIGFHHIALDLEGYRTGSMNRALASV